MRTQLKSTENAIRAVRRSVLKALDVASDRCLALFPKATSDPETARLVFNIVASQANETVDLYLHQFAQALDTSLGNAWCEHANAEITDIIKEVEAST